MRNTVLHFGSAHADYQGIIKRFASFYGLIHDSVDKAEADWRRVVTPKLKNAAFVFIWNGLQGRTALCAEYCKRNNVPHAFFEWGMLPQHTTFFVDPGGFCGNSILCDDLSWVTNDDLVVLDKERAKLQAKNPISDNGDILVPLQIFDDTQVLYHTPYDDMQSFVKHLCTIFPKDRLLIRPHPKGRADYSDMGVRIDDARVPFIESAARCHSVVGLTSTSLLEAAVLGKPVMALGDCALRIHNPSRHDVVAAGALALSMDRRSGDAQSVLSRFGLRPIDSKVEMRNHD